MTYQLNPNIETFLLLLTPQWGKEQKKEVIKELDEFGVNGAAFYAANYAVFERYHVAFASRMVATEGSVLFEDMSEELMFLLIGILFLHPEWLDDFRAVPDEEVLAVVRELIIEFLDGEEEIIGALETRGFSDQAKWQITALLQEPKQRLTMVIDAVNANRAAFEYAYSKLGDEIAALIVQFEEQVKKGHLPAVASQVFKFNSETQTIPSIAAPLAVMGFDELTIYGLLINKLFAGQEEGLTETEAILVAKSLSDISKLTILRALKEESLYNLEIANKLGLTPATTSHHMSMLLSAGLVEVSKKEGKVYYSLSVDGLKRYRDWLDESLL